MSHDQVFPLAILASKLITGPPSLSRLIDLMEDSDSVGDFLNLVRGFLPQHEAEIMAEVDASQRIGVFRHFFEEHYFPLEDGMYDDWELQDFTHHIPVALMGFSSSDWEAFGSMRDGLILLLSMMESPYDPGERVPILDYVKDLVGKRLVEMIPPEGWSTAEIEARLSGKEYEGCVAFAKVISFETGCWQLDANWEDYGPEDWSRDTVDGLTEQWPMVQELQGQINSIFDWIEEDIHRNFEEILALMNDTEIVPVPKEQMPFPLDDDGQVIQKEVMAIGRR